jgi:hypothetical protein
LSAAAGAEAACFAGIDVALLWQELCCRLAVLYSSLGPLLVTFSVLLRRLAQAIIA